MPQQEQAPPNQEGQVPKAPTQEHKDDSMSGTAAADAAAAEKRASQEVTGADQGPSGKKPKGPTGGAAGKQSAGSSSGQTGAC